jgi:hypothetical protein
VYVRTLQRQRKHYWTTRVRKFGVVVGFFICICQMCCRDRGGWKRLLLCTDGLSVKFCTEGCSATSRTVSPLQCWAKKGPVDHSSPYVFGHDHKIVGRSFGGSKNLQNPAPLKIYGTCLVRYVLLFRATEQLLVFEKKNSQGSSSSP